MTDSKESTILTLSLIHIYVVCHVNHRNNQINHYQYDFIGRILGKDSSDGMRLRTVYDDKNRVKSCTYLVEGKGNTTEYIYGEAEKMCIRDRLSTPAFPTPFLIIP